MTTNAIVTSDVVDYKPSCVRPALKQCCFIIIFFVSEAYSSSKVNALICAMDPLVRPAAY